MHLIARLSWVVLAVWPGDLSAQAQRADRMLLAQSTTSSIESRDGAQTTGAGHAVQTGRNSNATINSNTTTNVFVTYDAFLERNRAEGLKGTDPELIARQFDWASEQLLKLPKLAIQSKEASAMLDRAKSMLSTGPTLSAIEAGLAALDNDDPETAYQRFEEAARHGADTIEVVARARFQQGLIAEKDFDLVDAADKYEIAARIAPEEQRYLKAIEFQILIGALEKAETLALDFVEFAEGKHGAIDAATASARHAHGEVLWEDGKYEEAAEQISSAIEISRSIVGGAPKELGQYLSDYATVLVDLARYGEASSAISEALDITAAISGEDSEDYAARLADQATVLSALGEYGEALEVQKLSVDLTERILGKQHPELGRRLGALARLMMLVEGTPDAIEVAEHALYIIERRLGRKHAWYIDGMLDVAEARFGYVGNAESLAQYQEIVDLTAEVLGKSHPAYAERVSLVSMNLAIVGEHDLAREYAEESVALSRAIYGAEHPRYAAALLSLALAKKQSGQMAGLEALLQEHLAITEAGYGKDHPGTGAALVNVAGLMSDMGKPRQAIPLAQRAIDITLKSTGPDSQNYAQAMLILGTAYTLIGELEDAEGVIKTALAIEDQLSNRPSNMGSRIRVSLADVFYRQRRLGEAADVLRDAIDMAEARNATRSPLYFGAIVSQGAILADLGRHREAIDLLEEATVRIRDVHGEVNTVLALAYNNLGGSYNSLGRTVEARESFEQAANVLRQLGGLHPTLPTVHGNISDLLWDEGDTAGALDHARRAVSYAEQISGPDSYQHVQYRAVLALTLAKNGDREDAEDMARSAMAVAAETLEVASPRHINVWVHFVRVLEEIDAPEEATETQRELLAALKAKGAGTEKETLLAQTNNLSLLQRKIGDLDGAIETMRDIVAIDAATPDDTSAAKSLHLANLAHLLHQSGASVEAEAVYKDAIAFERRHGAESRPFEIETRLTGLAEMYENQGRYDEAEALYLEVLDLMKSGGDDRVRGYIGALLTLGRFYESRLDLAKARRFIDNALWITEYELGSDHEWYAHVHAHLAKVLATSADYDAALDAVNVAIELQVERHGARHLNTTGARWRKALILQSIGDLEGALRDIEDVISIRTEHKFETLSPRTARAGFLRDAGRLGEARSALERLLTEKTPRAMDEITDHLRRRVYLGRVLLDEGDAAEALRIGKEVAAQAERDLPTDRKIKGAGLLIAGRALIVLGDHDEARHVLDSAEAFAVALTGEASTETAKAKAAIAALRAAEADPDAMKAYTEAIGLLEARLGPKHPEVKRTKEAATRWGGNDG